MPIGDSYSLIANRKKLIFRLFGTLNLHSQIRLKPVVNFFKRLDEYLDKKNGNVKVLEIGCGLGINGFELFKILKKTGLTLNYKGVDTSATAIVTANKVLKMLNIDKEMDFQFIQNDAVNILQNEKDKYDVILLIDIIEHLKEPQKILFLLNNVLKNNGFIIISVPTPNYPKIFGRNFHNKIGHIVDGYFLEDLDDMMIKFGFKRVEYCYNTGLLANIGCYLYYNVFDFKNKYLNFLKQVILYPFRFLDFYNNRKYSCSLFVVYRKINYE